MQHPQTPTAQFGALRSMLHSPGWSFEQLVEFIARCELPIEHIEQTLIPYAAQHCAQTLQDQDREAPEAWIDALERGEEVVGWSLVRVAELKTLTHVLERPALLSHITELGLYIHDIASFNTLIKHPELAGLKKLYVSFERDPTIKATYGPHVDSVLWSSPHLSQLQELFIQEARVGLGAPPSRAAIMEALTRLELVRVQLSDQGCERLTQHQWPKLKRLSLSGNALQRRGITALMRAPWASQLAELDLSHNTIDEHGLRAILNHTQLTALTLDSTKLNAQALLRTLDHPGWSQIKHLSLNWLYTLGDAVIEAMAASPHFANLESLSLIWGGLSSRSALALANSPYITRLKHLDLYRNQLDDQGAMALAESDRFSQLEWLRVHDNDLSDAGRQAMRQSTMLARCVEHLGAHGF